VLRRFEYSEELPAQRCEELGRQKVKTRAVGFTAHSACTHARRCQDSARRDTRCASKTDVTILLLAYLKYRLFSSSVFETIGAYTHRSIGLAESSRGVDASYTHSQ